MKNNSKVRWRVLLFPVGTENALEVWRSLAFSKEILLYGAACPGSHHGPYVFNTVYPVPHVSQQGWVEELNKIVRNNAIDFVFPLNDDVIDALANRRSEVACPIILVPNETVRIVRSKTATLDALKQEVAVSQNYSTVEQIEDYPVFVKPDDGHGEQGAKIVHSRIELEAALSQKPDLLIQEFLPGKEYSVDCFTDRHDDLIFCGGRERVRVRMGTSVHSRLANEARQAELKIIASRISKKLKMRGPWFFQMKADADGNLKLLEVDARIAGTMALNRVRGINFPLLGIYDAAGENITILLNKYNVEIDRALVNRYSHDLEYDTIYVDLDDTLVVHEKLNLLLIRFLFQCLNKEKRLVLVSKSLEKDKLGFLRHWRIAELFDQIIWLPENQSKASVIKAERAIFIDDSFSERSEVSRKLGIPTFDPSMVEMLLDYRL